MMRPKEKLIFGGLVTVFLCLVFAEFLLFGSTVEQREVVAWVNQTNEVLLRLNQVVSGLSDAENAKRGYVLSGHDHYLLHHQDAVDRAQRALQRLRGLTKDDPRLTAEWDRLAKLIETAPRNLEGKHSRTRRTRSGCGRTDCLHGGRTGSHGANPRTRESDHC
jgi:CHASE3 domain sensor protein